MYSSGLFQPGELIALFLALVLFNFNSPVQGSPIGLGSGDVSDDIVLSASGSGSGDEEQQYIMALDDVISSASGSGSGSISGSGLFGSGDDGFGSGSGLFGSGDFYSGSGSGDFMGSGDDFMLSGDFGDGPLFENSDNLGLFDDEDVANDVITQLMTAMTEGKEIRDEEEGPATRNELNIDMPDEFPIAGQTNEVAPARGGKRPPPGNSGAASAPRSTMEMPDSLMDPGNSGTPVSQNSRNSNAKLDMPDEFGVPTSNSNGKPVARKPMTRNEQIMRAEPEVTSPPNAMESDTMAPMPFANAGEVVAEKKSKGPALSVLTKLEETTPAVEPEIMTTATAAMDSAVTMAPMPFANAGEVVAEKKSMGPAGLLLTKLEETTPAVEPEIMTTATAAMDSVTMEPMPFANAGEVVAEKKAMGNVMTKQGIGLFDHPYGRQPTRPSVNIYIDPREKINVPFIATTESSLSGETVGYLSTFEPSATSATPIVTEGTDKPSFIPPTLPMIPPLMAVTAPMFTDGAPAAAATTSAAPMMMATEAAEEPVYVPATMPPMIPPLLAVNPPMFTEVAPVATTSSAPMMMATEIAEEPSYPPITMPMIPPLMAVNPPVFTETAPEATTLTPMMMATEAAEEPVYVPPAMPLIPPLMAVNPPMFTEAPQAASTVASEIVTAPPSVMSEAVPATESMAEENESMEPLTAADTANDEPLIDVIDSSENKGKIIRVNAEIEVMPASV